MWKRKWQTVIFILLIVALSFVYIRMNNLFLHSEEVFWGCERGLKSGPSKEIVLQYERSDGSFVLVGRQEDGVFVVPVEKTHFFFWKLKNGDVDGKYVCEGDVDGYLNNDGKILGLNKNPDIVEVSFIVGNWADLNWQEMIGVPEEDGFICLDTGYLGPENHVIYCEGRGVDGEILYFAGDDDLAASLRKGNIRPSKPVVTKNFVTAAEAE